MSELGNKGQQGRIDGARRDALKKLGTYTAPVVLAVVSPTRAMAASPAPLASTPQASFRSVENVNSTLPIDPPRPPHAPTYSANATPSGPTAVSSNSGSNESLKIRLWRGE
jgi:hypothetical protein